VVKIAWFSLERELANRQPQHATAKAATAHLFSYSKKNLSKNYPFAKAGTLLASILTIAKYQNRGIKPA
jgi:hypothetical protein